MIFDLDGTLYTRNSELQVNIDVNTEEFLKSHYNGDIGELEKSEPNILSVLKKISLSKIEYKEKIYSKLDYNILQTDKKLKEILGEIDCHKCVVSLSPITHIETVLEKMGISKCFDFILSIFDLGIENKKDAYLHIFNKYGVLASEAVCIGDSYLNDLVPARELGVRDLSLITQQKNSIIGVNEFSNIYSCLEYIMRKENV